MGKHCIWPLHVVFAWFWPDIKILKGFYFVDIMIVIPYSLWGSLNVVQKELLSMEYLVSTKGSGNEFHLDKSHGTPMALY
jgi:hypothetical protein